MLAVRDFEVIPYEKENGDVPVMEFIQEQPNKMQAKILMETELLEEYGNELEGKYTKHLDDGIFELRIKLASDITRILYFFHIGKKIILTNGFVKKTQKTPAREIALAKKYRSDYLSREATR
ncbi:type II toxin-antitoxin system RelE/ParE family toxin [Bengtsoniella intestinalis]|uniref:type II toxin-antitoxin system RelE/ParE family toxin n=1 Tax=Bengtsoniella intestinalis TaxID=3073143 RepID=UPI00391F3C62